MIHSSVTTQNTYTHNHTPCSLSLYVLFFHQEMVCTGHKDTSLLLKLQSFCETWTPSFISTQNFAATFIFPLLLLWAYDSTLHISPLAAVVHLQNTTIHYPNSRGIFLLSISLRGKKNSSGTLQANKLTPKVSYMWNQDT